MPALGPALRGLRRSPAFVVAVIATLGIGIGLNTAIFAVVDGVLLRPLGFRDANRIVAFETRLLKLDRLIPRLGGDDYADLARQIDGLEATARYETFQDGFAIGDAAFYGQVAYASSRFTQVMGVEPVAGRLFHAGEQTGSDALVGEGFAREHFGSAQAALGRAVNHTGRAYTIVGVLPAGFRFPEQSEIWFEAPAFNDAHSRTAFNDHVIGKRRAEVTPMQLAAQVATFSGELQHTYPDDADKSIEVVPLEEQLVGGIRPTLRLLMGAASVIVLIICANLTHLQLVRATREARAVTIRTALGASRSAIAAAALLEAALLSAGGTAAAVGLAYPALAVMVRMAPPGLPRLGEIGLNLEVVFFAGLASFALMALAALIPVWRAGRVHPAGVLHQDASRGGETRGRLRVRSGLVVAEVALTLTLSVAAVLLARQLITETRQELGFAPQTLIALDTHAISSIAPPEEKDETPAAVEAARQVWARINEANLRRLDAAVATLGALPGVESAAAMAGAPMSAQGGSDVDYAVRGRQAFAPGVSNLPHAEVRPVTPGLMRTLGVAVVRGRGLLAEDKAGMPPVVLINQRLAKTVFAGEDPLGHEVTCGYDAEGGWWRIVGVVGDVRGDSPGAEAAPTLYVPVAQHPREAADMQMVVRTRLAPAAMVNTLRARLIEKYPEMAVKAATMREQIGETERPERFRTGLLASFAAVSILLAAVGMYGVTAYSVAQRRYEFGVRMALGSSRAQLLRLVLGAALRVGGTGIVVGLGLSLAAVRALASVVGPLPRFDAGAYGVAVMAVLVLCIGPAVWPARRAASIDPMQALRSE